MVRDPRFHRRSNAQGLVNAAKIVAHEVKRDGVAEILYFLGEWIR
jgi:hypothetical protein